ncbi:MAG: tetratricopeptide repeat protein [Syntrophales bacterium]|nr:tetratricopeptide repeat protein [Syntrophales bacterium]
MRALAERSAAAGDFDGAVGYWRQAIALNPRDESLLMNLAWAYHDGGQMEAAIACLEELLERELSRRIFTGFAFDELVRIYKRERLLDRLVAICERVVAAQPDDFALLGELGEAYLQAERATDAAAVFRRMLRLDPRESVVYCRLGDALVAAGDFAGAEEAYETATSIDPEVTGLFFSRLAAAFHKAGHLGEAERALRRSIAHDADQPAYYLSLGDILLEGGDAPGAFAAYEVAVRLNGKDAGNYYHRLGNAFMKFARYAEAARAYDAAALAEPANPLYLLRLAEACLAGGDKAGAQAALARARRAGDGS